MSAVQEVERMDGEERTEGEEWKEGVPCPAPARKKRHLLLIFSAAVLVIGFSFYLIYSNSSGSVVHSCPASSSRFPAKDRRNQGAQCNLFSGEWVCDPYGSVYTNKSCNFIEAQQNCMRNGRPDSDFLYWRWKPYGCELPPFDLFKCINAMKNKSWAFIGDSIFRNHIQSMLFLLSKGCK